MTSHSTSTPVSCPSGSRHNSRAGHPGWRRCSALKYSRYSRASRLASRAPRSGTYATIRWDRTLAQCLLLLVLLLTPGLADAQTVADFFDSRTLQEVRLFINSRDLLELRDRYNENHVLSCRFPLARRPRAQCGGPRARFGHPKRDQARPEDRVQSLRRSTEISRVGLGRPGQRAQRPGADSRTHEHGVDRSHGAARSQRVVRPSVHQ